VFLNAAIHSIDQQTLEGVKMKSVFSRMLAITVSAVVLICGSLSAMQAMAQVAFDVNQLAPAREAGSLGVLTQRPDSRLVDVQLDVSALFTPGDPAVVTEYTVRIVSRHEEVQVADFAPRTELQSEILGSLQVSSNQDQVREAAIRGMGGYPGVGSAQGYAYYHDNNHENVHYAKKPPMELVSASGTIERRKGVYFKVKQSTQTTLEGARPFRIVFEVPDTWRADLLDVTIEAAGQEHSGARRTRVLSSQQFVVAIFQEFDDQAARVATGYARQQERLKQYAKNNAKTIEHRNFPTPFHKLGAKLDIYEPSIPEHWLESLIYEQGVSYNLSKLSSLPVDVRVAIMNYLDQKHLIESMSGSRQVVILASKGPSMQDFAQR
jgi:hypothetical protein